MSSVEWLVAGVGLSKSSGHEISSLVHSHPAQGTQEEPHIQIRWSA